MASSSAMQIQDSKFAALGLEKRIVGEERVCCYSRGLGEVGEENPVLVLIHGYPQSSYLKFQLPSFNPPPPPINPLFIPDIPGYGLSAPIPQNDKLTIGTTLLSALQLQLSQSSSPSPSTSTPVILVGHDRGARIIHRLAVSRLPNFSIQGICLLDIVPTLTQWGKDSTAGGSKAAMGQFHWPLLANVALATSMINAYGGDKWCLAMLERWSGSNPTGLNSFHSNNSIAVYTEFFKNEDVVLASCRDYEAGATTDVEAQERDQKEGRKIACPVLVVYSERSSCRLEKG
ncbi:hypothetical protein P154DRAFT_534656 [Amniculicola lignicola CBS 123094]|uniref:Uncharacterized protein n=1 Tax=Amniculicola lignicola CBS 123094 TaxID=1392246 RepID=A0A6A5WII8_9PLEO|nr:hypothetical protein P154DRAFT_534656 [Amniculicola lignicola CBS 123094]